MGERVRQLLDLEMSKGRGMHYCCHGYQCCLETNNVSCWQLAVGVVWRKWKLVFVLISFFIKYILRNLTTEENRIYLHCNTTLRKALRFFLVWRSLSNWKVAEATNIYIKSCDNRLFEISSRSFKIIWLVDFFFFWFVLFCARANVLKSRCEVLYASADPIPFAT